MLAIYMGLLYFCAYLLLFFLKHFRTSDVQIQTFLRDHLFGDIALSADTPKVYLFLSFFLPVLAGENCPGYICSGYSWLNP